jgi:hypothetical protein
MHPDQLNEMYLQFKRKDLPEVFLFLRASLKIHLTPRVS